MSNKSIGKPPFHFLAVLQLPGLTGSKWSWNFHYASAAGRSALLFLYPPGRKLNTVIYVHLI
ncbi:hypothetical protein B9K06_20500 [Bacillus sp. OG2]|nr:hypothetical protein B9K06_20500 [Bacillus sp. OG2]